MRPVRFSVVTAIAVSATFAVAGCNRSGGRQEEIFTSADLQAARKAMTPNEVSLMLRSGYGQQDIVKQVEQRHLIAKLDAPTEKSIVAFGASPMLIQALKNEANVLNKAQQCAYNHLLAERDARNQANRLAEQDNVDSYASMKQQESDQRQKQYQTEQTVKRAQSMEDRVTLYDEAQREYIKKKSQLEYQIAAEQARINMKRGRGAGDDMLASNLQCLERYQKELAQLREPTR